MSGDSQTGRRVAVFGASGGLGQAFCTVLQDDPQVSELFELSRAGNTSTGAKSTGLPFDMSDEGSIQDAARVIGSDGPLHMVIVATGVLHDDEVQPEKRALDLDSKNLAHLFHHNTIGPALVAKYMLPLLDREKRSVFAALSARVGSISDNRLGGWHSYRASKAALNMILRTLSVELAYKNPGAICVALHPGTVDTGLSKPFQRNVPDEKLFTPHYAATQMLSVLNGLTPEDSGGFFAWDGKPIPY